MPIYIGYLIFIGATIYIGTSEVIMEAIHVMVIYCLKPGILVNHKCWLMVEKIQPLDLHINFYSAHSLKGPQTVFK